MTPWHCRAWALFVAALLSSIAIGHILAAPPVAPKAPTAKPTPAPTSAPMLSEKDKALDQQASAWAAFYSGKYDEAIKLCDPLVKLPERNKVEALHCQARCFWAQGTPESRAKAKQYWAGLEKQSTLNMLLHRLRVAKALQLQADGKNEGAAELLQGFLQDPLRDTSTAEAAIEYGLMQVRIRKFDDAKKAYQFAIDFLADLKSSQEFSPIEMKPFDEAARKLLDRLKYDKDSGREPFEKAEGLRTEKKFAEATAAYRAVIKDFPGTDYAVMGELCIGYCLADERKFLSAADHFKRFIQVAPIGPWRGQAYVTLIDMHLDDLLSLEAAVKFVDQAKNALDAAMKEDAASESWKLAAADIQLRVGIVAYLNNDAKTAGEALEQAASSADAAKAPKEEADGLKHLSACAKAGKPLIPEDVSAAKGDKKVAMALALGTIYNATGKAARAEDLFDRVLCYKDPLVLFPPQPLSKDEPRWEKAKDSTKAGHGESGSGKEAAAPRQQLPPIPNGTPAQIAFAIFGKAYSIAADTADQKQLEAKEYFLSSLTAFKDGSWHDETLYRIAMILQDHAENTYGQRSIDREKAAWRAKIEKDAIDKAKREGKDAKAAQAAGENAVAQAELSERSSRLRMSKDERERLDRPARVRHATFLMAENEVLRYWQEVVRIYGSKSPKVDQSLSPRIEPSKYYIAAILQGAAEAVEPSKSQQAWNDAASALANFCEKFPRSRYSGEAWVSIVDIALERQFNIADAERACSKGVLWLKERSSAGPKEDAAVCPWRLPADDGVRSEAEVAAEVYLRSGLVHYLNDRYDQAADAFVSAGAVDLQDGSTFSGTLGLVGVSLLKKAASRKTVLWSVEALSLADSEKVKLALKLADTYLFAQCLDKAQDMYQRLTSGDPALGTLPPKLRAYCMMQLGLSCAQAGNTAEAIDQYSLFYGPEYADSQWTPDAILRLGVVMANATHDYRQSIRHYQYVFTKYPQHPEAERAMFFYCLELVDLRERALAEESCRRFLRQYPSSQWHGRIKVLLTDVVPSLPTTRKGESR